MILLAAVAALAALPSAPAAGQTGGETARLHQAAADISARELPPLQEVLAQCPHDALCAAALLAEALGTPARLQKAATPSSDAIRGVEKRPSLETGASNAAGWPVLRLHRFGRDALWEMHAALRQMQEAAGVALDLRANGGGDFDRMLRVAGLFCGAQKDAVRLRGGAAQGFDIPAGETAFSGEVWQAGVEVWIGAQTASSAEVLAALLKRCAGARLLGERSFGKDVLLREVAVQQGWRLLVPAGRLEVAGVNLSGGLLPDAGLPIGATAPAEPAAGRHPPAAKRR